MITQATGAKLLQSDMLTLFPTKSIQNTRKALESFNTLHDESQTQERIDHHTKWKNTQEAPERQKMLSTSMRLKNVHGLQINKDPKDKDSE